MTRAEMLQELREVLDDTVAPYGWSNIALFAYLSEGQDKFCEDTGYFIDNTNYTITTVAGTASYAIDERIIEVLEVWNGGGKLQKFTQAERPVSGNFHISEETQPYAWQADQETGMLTLFPTPQAVITLNLRVWRYPRIPLTELTVVDAVESDTEPTIPKRFRRACVEWAAYKAFMHFDREQYDPNIAAKHKMAYREYVVQGRNARARQEAEAPQVRPSGWYTT